ncbi:MAG TPA: NUDIX domain-containing protein [Flavisolibacter sp.]|jgi:predicted NUDIX family NTP pyrophosphohydrolase|nr:NUDIX domain-containing protein [Flavisolibacter sp.]
MRKSAGILLYRRLSAAAEVLLVHPGGPFWKGKEKGAWTIPKGEFTEEEEPLQAALREFEEETGKKLTGQPIPLEPVRQKAGKLVMAWALEGDLDASTISSNTFRIEWPYKSGKWQTIPEVDKAGWFTIQEAEVLINPAQSGFLKQLQTLLTNL